MTGRVVRVTTTDPTVTGTAAVAGPVVRLLLGRHAGCFPATLDCTAANRPASRRVSLSVRLPQPAALAYTVVVRRITAGSDAVPVSRALRVVTRHGVLMVPLGALNEGDAVTVTVREA
jgi:hypothetical protein